MTFGNFISSHFNAKGLNTIQTLCHLCKVRSFYFSVCCNIDVNSALGENAKEPSSSKMSTEAPFNDDSHEKTLNVNKVY